MSATRGVLYMKWGTQADAMLQRSAASLRSFHPELPVHVAELPAGATLLDKARMLDASPFEETLFLDIDTVVLDRLDYGFDKAAKHSMACCICECPWARRYTGLSGDMIEYNTGVLFFTRKARPLFERWKQYARVLDSSIVFKMGEGQMGRMALNDQGSFALAMEESETPPFILPMNWNFRPQWHYSFFGPIKIWHDYSEVPGPVVTWNENQRGEQKVIDFTRLWS